ncbi:MAG: DUF2809 domain-containing protein [Telluria sp.]
MTIITNPVRPTYRRNRLALALGIVLVIAVGLASRAYPALFPAVLGSHTGDGLWALMVLLGIAFIWPAMPLMRVAGAALAFAWVIELSQLYQAPWINAIRATTPGHLVLGTGFQWMDLLAYLVGIGCGFLGDYFLSTRPERTQDTRTRPQKKPPAS